MLVWEDAGQRGRWVRGEGLRRMPDGASENTAPEF